MLDFVGALVGKVIETTNDKTISLKEAIQSKNVRQQDPIVDSQPRSKSKENPELQLEQSPIKQLREPLPERSNPL